MNNIRKLSLEELEQAQLKYEQSQNLRWGLDKLQIGEEKLFDLDAKRTATKLKYAVNTYSRSSGKKFTVNIYGNKAGVCRVSATHGTVSERSLIEEVKSVQSPEDREIAVNLAVLDSLPDLGQFLSFHQMSLEAFNMMSKKEKSNWLKQKGIV